MEMGDYSESDLRETAKQQGLNAVANLSGIQCKSNLMTE